MLVYVTADIFINPFTIARSLLVPGGLEVKLRVLYHCTLSNNGGIMLIG